MFAPLHIYVYCEYKTFVFSSCTILWPKIGKKVPKIARWMLFVNITYDDDITMLTVFYFGYCCLFDLKSVHQQFVLIPIRTHIFFVASEMMKNWPKIHTSIRTFFWSWYESLQYDWRLVVFWVEFIICWYKNGTQRTI